MIRGRDVLVSTERPPEVLQGISGCSSCCRPLAGAEVVCTEAQSAAGRCCADVCTYVYSVALLRFTVRKSYMCPVRQFRLFACTCIHRASTATWAIHEPVV